MQAWGMLDLDVALTRAGSGRWQGEGTLRSTEGGLRVAEELEYDVFGYRALDVQFSLAGDVLDARLQAGLAAGGTIAATLRTGLAATKLCVNCAAFNLICLLSLARSYLKSRRRSQIYNSAELWMRHVLRVR
jgi:hypothetical protein